MRQRRYFVFICDSPWISLGWLTRRAHMLTAKYGGADQRAAWPLSRGRAPTCGTAVRPCRPRQML
eukprot:1973784-Pleurochrysis_carterae.AAC.1